MTAASTPSLSHRQWCKVPGGCGPRLLTGVQILSKKCSLSTTPNPPEGQPVPRAHFHLKLRARTRATLIIQRPSAVSVNLQQIVTVPSNTTTFLFRNDMFRSKQTVIRPSLHKIHNKLYCSANCIIAYFKVFVTFVFVLVEVQRFVQYKRGVLACSLLPSASNCRIKNAADWQSSGPQFLQLACRRSVHTV